MFSLEVNGASQSVLENKSYAICSSSSLEEEEMKFPRLEKVPRKKKSFLWQVRQFRASGPDLHLFQNRGNILEIGTKKKMNIQLRSCLFNNALSSLSGSV